MDTYADRDPRILDHLTELGTSAEQLRRSDGWKQFLEVSSRFHSYSTNNQILIWAQFPTASYVAGYNAWLQMGWQRQSNEVAGPGIKIIAPMKRKVEDSATGETGIKVTGFRLVTVHDISQCERIAADSYTKKGKEHRITNRFDPIPWPEAKACPPGMFDDLVSRARVSVSVEITPIDGGARARYESNDDIIKIDTGLDEPSRVSALLHELGHRHDPLLAMDQDRRKKELVAESVAAVLARQLGVDCNDEVDHYLASWNATPKDMVVVAKRVTESVDAIRPILLDDVVAPPRADTTPTQIEEAA